jgi:hypothetical protein
MALTPDQADALIVANAAALGLVIPAESRAGVRRYLALAAAMAELVDGLPLCAHDEPGNVFRPLPPHTGEAA